MDPSPQPTQPEDYDGPYTDLADALDAFSNELERRLKNPPEGPLPTPPAD